MKAFWEERYGAEAYAYGTEPNTFLRQQLAGRAPGRALFPAEGEGRNAVFAATLGHEVVAFDQSEAGRRKALALAAARQVALTYEIADATAMPFSPASFDLIALIYVHLPAPLRQGFHRAVQRLLRPGGTLILEGFGQGQLGRASGGPRELEMLFTPEMLRQDFDELAIDVLEATETTLHEGAFHEGDAAVVRLVATKPG